MSQSKSRNKKKRSSRRTSGSSKSPATFEFLFGWQNYKWVLMGLGLILLGMILMLGGEQSSPDVWEPEKIYSFTRITLAPALILAGLAFQIVAIFKK